LQIEDCRLKILSLVCASLLASVITGFSQESSPIESPPASPVISPSLASTAPPARSVRIRFLPPPLEGTISLGIYNEGNQLVRVLHQEADLDEFEIGEDALSTKWDGKDDDGQMLPPGKYQARGFAIGNLKAQPSTASPTSSPPDLSAPRSVSIRLVANPLENDERKVVQLSVGFDDENSYLKTADGLPVFTLSSKPTVRAASLAKAGEKALDVWQDDGTAIEQIHVTNVDKMMAFDCGEIELK
jgi:hypothetical protein